jgi:hypothetical protein
MAIGPPWTKLKGNEQSGDTAPSGVLSTLITLVLIPKGLAWTNLSHASDTRRDKKDDLLEKKSNSPEQISKGVLE